jgi:hypothetical protein
VLLDQASQQTEPLHRAGEAADATAAAGEPDRDAQVAGAGGELEGMASDEFPVGGLRGDHGVAELLLGPPGARHLERMEGRVVLRVDAARRVGSQGGQQVCDFERWHAISGLGAL